MGTMLVVVTCVDAQHVGELPLAEDQDPVEAFAPDGAHPALEVGVRRRRLERSSDHADPLGREDRVEGARELLVAVMDQEAHPPATVAELHQHAPGLLQHPGGVRIGGAGDELDPAGSEREEDEHIQPLQPYLEFAHDPLVAPRRVLARELQHQLA